MPPQPPTDFASTGGPAAVTATGTNGAYGIFATSDDGVGVAGSATTTTGVFGGSTSGIGVNATSETGVGLFASSGGEFAVQVFAAGSSLDDIPPGSPAAIFADGGPGFGVVASSYTNAAISATSDSGIALAAKSTSGPGIVASTEGGAPGVSVTTDTGIGVEVRSNTGTAVQGSTVTSTGVAGSTDTGIGVSANGGTAGVALQVVGKIQVQGNSAGQVTMPTGHKTLNVNNAAATANSLIFLMPLETPAQAFLSIGARSAGSFTIDASTAQTKPMTIGYLIIN